MLPASRRAPRAASTAPAVLRRLSAAPSAATEGPTNVTVDPASGVATLRLQAGPANVLSRSTCRAVVDSLTALEAAADVDKCVLTAGTTGVFSAGLDLKAFYQPDEAEVQAYWRDVQTMFQRLYSSPLFVAARINGHAPAGGCILGLASDVRVMQTHPAAPRKGEFKIGLNEAQIGMLVPWWIQRLMIDVVGQRQGERALCLGLLYSAQQAHEVGLVDHLAEDEPALDALVEYELQLAAQVPAETRAQAKLRVRGAVAQAMVERLDQDAAEFTSTIMGDTMQAALEQYLTAMENRKAKK